MLKPIINIFNMETQQHITGPGETQGKPTSDRAFSDHNAEMKQNGISNGGGQRSDQTSNRDSERKQATRKSKLSHRL
jgi:hypothetical protein